MQKSKRWKALCVKIFHNCLKTRFGSPFFLLLFDLIFSIILFLLCSCNFVLNLDMGKRWERYIFWLGVPKVPRHLQLQCLPVSSCFSIYFFYFGVVVYPLYHFVCCFWNLSALVGKITIKNLQINLGNLRSENPKVEIKVSKHIVRKPKNLDGKSCRKYAMTATLSGKEI